MLDFNLHQRCILKIGQTPAFDRGPYRVALRLCSYTPCSFLLSLCVVSITDRRLRKLTSKAKALQCSHHSSLGWVSFGWPGSSQQCQMMGNATTRTATKMSTRQFATRKPISVPAVFPATSVSVMGSAKHLPMDPSHLTLQAYVRTIRGVHLRYALRYAIKIKIGKSLPTML